MATPHTVIQRYFLPRQLHPFAWWGYALTIAVAASTASNPLLLIGLVAVVCLVTVSRRGSNPWARSFRLYLYLAAFIVVMRIGFRILFGGGDGPTILFTLPEVPLPDWVQGIRLLGPVSLESVLTGFYDGARLATIVVCFGAANSLANPKKLLSSLPSALYELGTIMIVAVSALPQLGESLQRVARARKLRQAPAAGTRRHKLRLVHTIIVPVLSDALERSLSLAASMDVRGYGRSGQQSPHHRRLALGLGLTAMAAIGTWGFRFLGHSPDTYIFGLPLISSLLLLVGIVSAIFSLRVSGATVRRTQYRPIRWRLAESLTVACGAMAAATVAWIATYGDASILFPSVSPFQWPTLNLPLLLVLCVAALPAFLTPAPESGRPA